MGKLHRKSGKSTTLRRLSFTVSMPFKLEEHINQEAPPKFRGAVYKKLRQWQYITKPFFKRIKEPIADVFKKAEEVQIIIDLGNFKKGELNFNLEKGTYFISGKHEDCEFYEEIPLPYDVDVRKIKEHFRSGILELILPKKKQCKRSKENEK